MSIRTKLIAASTLNLLLLIALGLFAVNNLEQINANATFLGSNTVSSLVIANQMNDVANDYRILQAEYFTSRDAAQISRIGVKMAEAEKYMQRYFQQYEPGISDDKERANFERIRTGWSNFVNATHRDFIPAARSNDPAATTQAFNQLNTIYTDLTESTASLMWNKQRQGNDAVTSMQAVYSRVKIGVIAVTVGAFVVSGVAALVLASALLRNLRLLTTATTAVAAGDLEQVVKVRSRDELGHLATAFNHMLGALRTARAEIDAHQAVLETRVVERTAELQQTMTDLRAALDTQAALSKTIRDLQNPAVPIMDGVLVLPLIGAFDSQRAAQFHADLLHAIEMQRAHTVLLDVTGLPVVDTLAAQTLIQASAAAKLLGAKVVLVGLAPAVAQTIVGLGLDLRSLRIERDLQSAVTGVLARAA